ncbi:MAG: (d)CMP kinase [Clostridia bacterium]|nr:(d)CMP kinase [Clostridia bacterium]
MLNIALDGPSGSGKSTVSDIVAERLNILHLNTGAIYRAIGYYFDSQNIDVRDKDLVISKLSDIHIEIKFLSGVQRIYLNNVDVSDNLYSMRISDICSISAAYIEVRELVAKIQREVADTYDVIMEGRDICSHVLPNAKYKFYLDASARNRAIRRINDSKNKDKLTIDDLERVTLQIEERDRRDMERDVCPLKKVDDAIYINCDELSANEVADIIVTTVLKEVL